MVDDDDGDDNRFESDEEEPGMLLIAFGFGSQYVVLAGSGERIEAILREAGGTLYDFDGGMPVDEDPTFRTGLYVWEGMVALDASEDITEGYTAIGSWRRATDVEADAIAAGKVPWPGTAAFLDLEA